MLNSSLSLQHSKTSPTAPKRGAVILFHGLTATPKEVEPLGSFLYELGFDVLMPLLSGHGETVEKLRRTHLAAWRKDARQALESCTVRPLVVGGVSLGAMLALDLAIRSPKEVSAIISLSAPAKLRSPKTELRLALLAALPDRVIDQLKTTPKKNQTRPLAFPRDCFSEHSIGALVRLAQLRRGVLPKLKKIRAPVLLLQDPEDHHLSPLSQELLKKKLSSAPVESHEIRNGGHELILSMQYAEVFEYVRRFLEPKS